MSDADTLSTLSLIFFIAAGVAFAAAIFLFFYFRIMKVVSDLSGRTAKRSIQSVRSRNEQSGNKSYRSSKTNKERGKITDAIPKHGEKKNKGYVETGLLREEKTAKLSDIPEGTEELGEGARGPVLHDRQNATEVLEQTNATTMLPAVDEELRRAKENMRWKILEDIILIHTDEVIPWRS